MVYIQLQDFEQTVLSVDTDIKSISSYWKDGTSHHYRLVINFGGTRDLELGYDSEYTRAKDISIIKNTLKQLGATIQ